MSNAEQISKWLNYPNEVSSDELGLIESLADKYPYCMPLQYISCIQNKENKSIVTLKQIFPVNPVLLHQWTQPSTKDEKISSVHSKLEFHLPQNTDYFNLNDKDGQAEIADLDYWKKKDKPQTVPVDESLEKSLMVVMSFSDWLLYLDTKIKKGRDEEESQKALRAMWQKQRLAEVMEEEGEEIPEQVFEMAVKSILPEEELISETLAVVFAQQGKKDKAIEMYKKLSLQNPEKNGYFAQKIKNLQKEI